MHIPGKFSSHPKTLIRRNPNNRFFRRWAADRRNRSGCTTLLWPQQLMSLPNAQRVAQIAGNQRRLAMWQDACEQANDIATQRRHSRALREAA